MKCSLFTFHEHFNVYGETLIDEGDRPTCEKRRKVGGTTKSVTTMIVDRLPLHNDF